MPENQEHLSCEQILHDIKTPLSIMYGSIREIERMLAYTPEAGEALETLKQNWLRILKLVTDAGDYQKLSLGLMLPKLCVYDIVALVRNITESARTLAARKNILMEFETTLSERRMSVDKDIVDRILLNLLSNAIKFTGCGGIVRVTLTEKSGVIILSVIDNGIGIPLEYVNRVFEPHFFVDSPYNSGGTGMGLFIVRQLVKLLAGEICFEPVAIGSVVTVRLPCFITESSIQEHKYFGDFYSDNMVQIELSDAQR